MTDLQQWIDELPALNKAVLFVAILAGVGYVFYGRDGSLQFLLPFPQTEVIKRA